MRAPRAHAKQFVQSLENSVEGKVLVVLVLEYSHPQFLPWMRVA